MKRRFTIEDALTLKSITGRMPIHLSKDGGWLAYTVESSHKRQKGGRDFLLSGAPVCMEGCEVWVTEVESGESQNLTPDWGTSWSPRWSPGGSRLAFYSDRNGAAQLWVWERSTGQAKPVCEAVVRASFEFEIPRWTPDGLHIVLKLQVENASTPSSADAQTEKRESEAEKEEASTVKVWSFSPEETAIKDSKKQRTEYHPAGADRYLSDIAVVNVATEEVRRLARDVYPVGIDVLSDGRTIALMNHLGSETQTTQQQLYNLMLVSLDGNAPHCLVPRIRQDYGISISGSPDGTQIAYTTDGPLAKGELFVVSVADGKVRNLTEGVDGKFGHPYERPLWSADGEHLFCLGASNLWQISIKDGYYRNLTEGLGRNITAIVHENDGNIVWSSHDRSSVTVQTQNLETKQMGFYQIDLTSGRGNVLVEEKRCYGGISSGGIFSVDVKNDRIVYIAEDAKNPPDFWLVSSDFQNRHRLTNLNPQLVDVYFGETRLIRWKTEKGKSLQGVLLLPANYQEGQRYPMITRVYGGGSYSHALNRFGVDLPAVENNQLLASAGYAVFTPDAPLETNDPLRELGEIVLPGVDKVIEMGIADAERLGLMGHSYGGYSVNCLITQTTRFKAAISSAGTSDLIGMYGVFIKGSDITWMAYLESGQGQMGGTLWEFPNRYIENSPVFYLDKVDTPLLLIQGEEDGVPLSQSEEMFTGLRRLGKKVTLARYSGEGHWQGTWRYANVVDYWNRVLAWVDENL